MRIFIKLQTIFLICLISLITLLFVIPKTVNAQALDYECIGEGLADYMNTIIEITGDLQHIRLLSPAFNMSTYHTPKIIEAMDDANANWEGLYGIAGNAYNHDNSITYWVDSVMSYFPGMPIMLTETGYITGTFQDLLDELSLFRDGSHNGVTYIGAALFNAFGSSTDPRWLRYIFTDDQLSQICGESCGIIGVNSAEGYHQPEDFYQKAFILGMTKTVEIYTTDANTTEGVKLAHSHSIQPTIRAGFSDSGPDAVAYAQYLLWLDTQVSDTVYAIAGPNEPDNEFWATPWCDHTGGDDGGDDGDGEDGEEEDWEYGLSHAVPHAELDLGNVNVPCYTAKVDEFHSLRPYQMSPCRFNLEDISLFCGNDFIILDTVVIEKHFRPLVDSDPNTIDAYFYYTFEGEGCETGGPSCDMDGSTPKCEYYNCVPNGDGTETCDFSVDRVFDIAIDLEGADLPIMGYTELSEERELKYPEVVNWVNKFDEEDETLSNSDKVNEYLSWYLNGAIGRAEYSPPDPETAEGKSKIVDYSGPLKRLLPFEGQIPPRIKQIEDAEISQYCEPYTNDPRCIRHNQKIGCLDSSNPIGCYESGMDTYYRLSHWWTHPLPPLRNDYDTFDEYITAFENWRNNPVNQLFPNIPFSSTEDKLGRVQIFEYEFQPMGSAGTELICSAITSQTPAELFFSHMKEGVEVADLLQRIHSPQDAELDAQPLNVQAIEYPLCIIAETRRNPGDYLFATELLATIQYTAQVTCTFTSLGDGALCGALTGECVSGLPENYVCTDYYGYVDCAAGSFCASGCTPVDACNIDGVCKECGPNPQGEWTCEEFLPCCTGYECSEEGYEYTDPDGVKRVVYSCVEDPIDWEYDETCTSAVYVTFATRTMTPLSRSIWSKLVANPAGVFRRIFPQIEDSPDRPIRRLWDIPTETDVVFTTTGPVTVVGGPYHKLYFPHIGGIHEYFLNCLQKTLRPQGFGQGCISAPIFPPPSDPGSGNPPPTGNIIPGPIGPPPEGCWPLVPGVTYNEDGSWTACLCYPYGEGIWGDIWVKVYVNGNLYSDTSYIKLSPGDCWCISGTAKPGSVVCVEYNSRNVGEQCGGGGYECFVP